MPPAQPQSPNHDFDFMLKDQSPAGRSLPLTNLPKPIVYGVFGLIIIVLLIVALSLFSGRNKGSSQPMVKVVARSQEIIRVTSLVQTQLQPNDSQTTAIAATVAASLTSDQQRLTGYLLKSHIKLSPAQLAVDTDKTTDISLQTAKQNNNLDQTYVSYLRGALNIYENDLKAAYQKSGPKGRVILNDASVSTAALLNSPPLKS